MISRDLEMGILCSVGLWAAAEGIGSEAANAPGAGRVIGWRAGAAGLSGGGAALLDAGEVVERVVGVEGDVRSA